MLRSVLPLRRAAQRLGRLGFDVEIDAAAALKAQRFAGDDDARLAAIHRVAAARPSVALATRGGYGLTRLLDRHRLEAHRQTASRAARAGSA